MEVPGFGPPADGRRTRTHSPITTTHCATPVKQAAALAPELRVEGQMRGPLVKGWSGRGERAWTGQCGVGARLQRAAGAARRGREATLFRRAAVWHMWRWGAGGLGLAAAPTRGRRQEEGRDEGSFLNSRSALGPATRHRLGLSWSLSAAQGCPARDARRGL